MDKAVSVIRGVLVALLRVERWHATPPSRHPYRQAIVSRVSTSYPEAVLEFGCGFGDIINSIPAKRCLGTDVSRRVTFGARACHPLGWLTGRVHYKALSLGAVIEGKYSAIISVNFIHAIPPEALRRSFSMLVRDNLQSRGMLVFDVVADPSYRYNHSADFLLEGLGMEYEVVDGFEFGRSLVFATKIA